MKFSLLLFMASMFLPHALIMLTVDAKIYLVYADQITFISQGIFSNSNDAEKKSLIKGHDIEQLLATQNMNLDNYISIKDLSSALEEVSVGAHNLMHYSDVFKSASQDDFWHSKFETVSHQDGIVHLLDLKNAFFECINRLYKSTHTPLFVFKIPEESDSEFKIKLIVHPHDLKSHPRFGCMDPSKYDNLIDSCCNGNQACNGCCYSHAKKLHKHVSWLPNCLWATTQIFCCFSSAPLCSVACTCGTCLLCAACATGNL